MLAWNLRPKLQSNYYIKPYLHQRTNFKQWITSLYKHLKNKTDESSPEKKKKKHLQFHRFIVQRKQEPQNLPLEKLFPLSGLIQHQYKSLATTTTDPNTGVLWVFFKSLWKKSPWNQKKKRRLNMLLYWAYMERFCCWGEGRSCKGGFLREAKGCARVRQSQFQPKFLFQPVTGQSWVPQLRWWCLCDNLFKKSSELLCNSSWESVVRNSLSGTKVSEEEVGGSAPRTGAEVPL